MAKVQQTAPDDLRALLAQVRRRWLTRRALQAATRVALATLGLLAVVLAADRLLRLPDGPLAGLFAAALAVAAALAGRAAWRLRRAPDDRQMARYVEERCPALDDRLASAADAARRARPSVFRDLLMADAVRAARAAGLQRVVPRQAVRRSAAGGAAAVAALLLALGFGSDPLGRIARTTWLYAFPYGALLEVEPGDARVVAGRPLRLRATLRIAVGAPARSAPVAVLTAAGGRQRALRMSAVGGDAYELDVPAVEASFRYRVRAAALVSGEYAVTAVFPPRVERIDVAYDYPAHTGLPPRVAVDAGDVVAPAGTRVTVAVRMSKAVEHARLELGGGARLPLEPRSDGALAGSFEVRADDSYRVRARDADGLTNPAGGGYRVRAVQDRPPEVEIVRPGRDREITPLEEVTVEARAVDDYGLERFELVYGVMGRPERVAALHDASRPARVSGSHTIFGEDLDLRPGDFLTYHVRARDTRAGGLAGETRSDIYFLEVRPFEREFEDAPSQAGGGPEADDLRRLAEVQKAIVAATWKLDGGRPAPADVETVADSQGDLKLAVQALIARRRGPLPRINEGGAAGGAASGDTEDAPLVLAVEAMAAAETALRAQRPADALPPEMTAFRQLLRARAGLRRTQVAPRGGRSAQGGGAGAREDLSALFDRELRRDQQTNYEHRPQPDVSEPGPADDALRRRLRELADRQAAVNRRQEELARDRALAAGERERRLERLTREQEAVRRQAEDLRRALADPDRSGAGERAVRAAAEQMRRAANGLRRGDAAQAAQQGRQALDGLRELGRRLGVARGSGRRPLGELRREAQQLADAQRGVARAVGRGEGAAHAGNARNARRRLADREDRLAERVESLARRLEELEPGAPPAERAALQEAAQALRDEQVAQRMRALAAALRSAQDAAAQPAAPASGPLAELPAQTAAALERVAARLMGTGEEVSGGRRLSDELAEARRLRQRLDRLGERLAGDLRATRPDAQAAGPGAAPGAELAELAALAEQLERLGRRHPGLAHDLERWSQDWRSGAAPGLEAYKQDHAAWAALYSELQYVLGAFEASRARALAAGETGERLHAGPSTAAPEAYRRLVDRYYRSLASRAAPR